MLVFARKVDLFNKALLFNPTLVAFVRGLDFGSRGLLDDGIRSHLTETLMRCKNLRSIKIPSQPAESKRVMAAVLSKDLVCLTLGNDSTVTIPDVFSLLPGLQKLEYHLYQPDNPLFDFDDDYAHSMTSVIRHLTLGNIKFCAGDRAWILPRCPQLEKLELTFRRISTENTLELNSQ